MTRTGSAYVCAALAVVFVTPVLAHGQTRSAGTTELERALRYVSAQEQVMGSSATAADVDALLSLVTDDFIYLHPTVNARVEGKNAVREGILWHLGETTDPQIRVSNIVQEGSVVTLITHSRFRRTDGGVVDRSTTWVLVFRGDLITLRADF